MPTAINPTTLEPFRKAGSANYIHEDGGYLAHVSFFAHCWSWVVWRDGAVVHGYRSFHMDAIQACEQAIDCIESSKAIPKRDFFAETI